MIRTLVILNILFAIQQTAYAQVHGCTDPLASNYNPQATVNDGSCVYTQTSISTEHSWLLPSVMDETSGLITFNQYMWTHNDHRDTNIYRLDTNDLGVIDPYPLPGTSNTDWEEIAQDSTHIYVGDFGNNANGNRTDLHILRIEKQSFLIKEPIIDTIWFSYELQPNPVPSGPNNTDFDCEAMIVSRDSIYLFTKEWNRQSSSIYTLPKIPGTYVARFKDSLNVQGMITGATFLEDERFIALCGYSIILQPFIYLLYDYQSDDFFGGNKRKIGLNLPFHQVEAITTTNGKDVFISNEAFSQSVANINVDQQLHRLNLSPLTQHYLTTVPSYNITKDFVNIYPNPFSDYLYIETTNHDVEVTIIDASGRPIHSEEIITTQKTINTTQWSPGIYVADIRVDGKQFRVKLNKPNH